jgi:hypothetical protein
MQIEFISKVFTIVILFCIERFEVFTAVTMKYYVFWDHAPAKLVVIWTLVTEPSTQAMYTTASKW